MLQGVLALFARGGEKVVAGATEQLAQVWLTLIIIGTTTGWCFGTCFFHILGIVTPTD
jgi:hypothetical protein